MQGKGKGEVRLQEIVNTLKEVDNQVYGDKRSQANGNYLGELKADVATNDPHGKSISTPPSGKCYELKYGSDYHFWFQIADFRLRLIACNPLGPEPLNLKSTF